jgi:hypothetical protein
MTKILNQNIKSILKEYNINNKDLKVINEKAFEELANKNSINKSFEIFIARILQKYGLQYMQIYSLITQIWLVIIDYKFDNITEISRAKFI